MNSISKKVAGRLQGQMPSRGITRNDSTSNLFICLSGV